MLPIDMAVTKPTCLLLLLAVWAGVFLGSCHGSPRVTADWVQHKPDESPVYMELAHYAVSTQVGNRTVYDTVVKLVHVSTQVVGAVNYNLGFVIARSNCKIGQVAYSAKECLPVGPAKRVCMAMIYVDPLANTKKVTSYHCFVIKDGHSAVPYT
uniref:Cystatin n=1 Tax=Rhipicephalus zambeziensis TaxID=60191 RepID=A0A224YCH6_9ACAR